MNTDHLLQVLKDTLVWLVPVQIAWKIVYAAAAYAVTASTNANDNVTFQRITHNFYYLFLSKILDSVLSLKMPQTTNPPPSEQPAGDPPSTQS